MENIQEHRKEIRNLIAADKITEAIKRSMDFVDNYGKSEELVDEIILISGNYKQLMANFKLGLITYEVQKTERNLLLRSLLFLIAQIVEDYGNNRN